MKMATSDVQLSFNNKIHRQILGLAMGLPLDSTLTNIFVGYLESKIIEELSSQVVYIKYIYYSQLYLKQKKTQLYFEI